MGMFGNDFRAMAAATLGACGLLLGGCAAETGEATRALGADAAVPVADIEPPEGLDEAAAPDWRVRASEGAIDGCSREICEKGEQCCALTGECVPVDCDDCCIGPELAGGMHDDPELDGPEHPDEPQ